MPENKDPEPTEYPEGLGDAGRRALDAERARRKQAEDEMRALRGEEGITALNREKQARTKAESDLAALREELSGFKQTLAEAFGVKSEKGADDSIALKQVQESLAEIKRENAVLAVANQRGITDEADINRLRKSRLEGDDLADMADRLKPADPTPGTPKPDASQGPKGDPPKPDALPGVPRMAQALEDALNTP